MPDPQPYQEDRKIIYLINYLELLYTFPLYSSPRAKRAGPKGPRAESARAVTGEWPNSHLLENRNYPELPHDMGDL